MGDERIRVGTCNCGAVRIETRGEPEFAIVCHCSACQKRTGSPFGYGLYWRDEAVVITGETKSFTRDTLRGNDLTDQFCPTCGTNTHWVAGSMGGMTGIAAGVFEKDDVPAPDFSVYDSRRHNWVSPANEVNYECGTNSPLVE